MKRQTTWSIEAGHAIFDLHFRELLAYRYLICCMAIRDIKAVYKQTILGPVWLIIQPLLSTGVYTIVFGSLARIDTKGCPPALFYLAGVIVWNYFSECLNRTSTVFRDNSVIFGKVYFPRLIVPISTVLALLFRFTIQLLLFSLAIVVFGIRGEAFQGNCVMLLLPILMLLMALQAIGIGIAFAALTTKYKDLSFLLAFAVQLSMYATPVIYPLSAAPQKLQWLILMNPMTAIIETFRFGFLGSGSFSWTHLFQSAAISVTLLFIGLIAFTKAEKNFTDHI